MGNPAAGLAPPPVLLGGNAVASALTVMPEMLAFVGSVGAMATSRSVTPVEVLGLETRIFIGFLLDRRPPRALPESTGDLLGARRVSGNRRADEQEKDCAEPVHGMLVPGG